MEKLNLQELHSIEGGNITGTYFEGNHTLVGAKVVGNVVLDWVCDFIDGFNAAGNSLN